jgi:Zn-dependent protease with chaperone function
MKQELLGNVFEPGRASLLCLLQVRPACLSAVEERPAEGAEARRFDFPLDPDSLSLSGDEGSVILMVNPEGAKLYCDRKRLEPLLRQHACGELLHKLNCEDKRARRQGRKAWLGLLGFAASIAFVCFLGLRVLSWGVDRAVDMIPVSWESNLGLAVVSGMTQGEVIDPAVTGPVQSVLDRVLSGAGQQPYSFTLHVVKSPEINAMALPGGQVIVYTGLLEKTDNPDELAGVLGHEIQHVLGRHGLRNMAHSLKWQIVASLMLGDLSSIQRILIANGPRFLSLSYGRGLEEQADLEGSRMLLKADVDPRGLGDFFRILQKQEGAGAYVPEILSSHPETQHRIDALDAFLATQPEADGSYTPIAVDWQAMKKSLAALK